eukprot:4277150-Alexandrium_andersonii.AAC.1
MGVDCRVRGCLVRGRGQWSYRRGHPDCLSPALLPGGLALPQRRRRHERLSRHRRLWLGRPSGHSRGGWATGESVPLVGRVCSPVRSMDCERNRLVTYWGVDILSLRSSLLSMELCGKGAGVPLSLPSDV